MISCAQLIRQAITSAAREAYETSDTGAHVDGPSFELTIPGIHLVYSRIQQRLHMFGEAVRLWPDCVVKLNELTTKLDNEMVCLPVMPVHKILRCLHVLTLD